MNKQSDKSITIASLILTTCQERAKVSVRPMKLLKLIYIAHGYMLGTHGKPLLDEPVLAWQYGPIVKSVYDQIRGYRNKNITHIPIGEYKPTNKEIAIVNKVVDEYAKQPAITLSRAITARGTPWHHTWHKAEENTPIPNSTIRLFYERLLNQATHDIS